MEVRYSEDGMGVGWDGMEWGYTRQRTFDIWGLRLDGFTTDEFTTGGFTT